MAKRYVVVLWDIRQDIPVGTIGISSNKTLSELRKTVEAQIRRVFGDNHRIEFRIYEAQ